MGRSGFEPLCFSMSRKCPDQTRPSSHTSMGGTRFELAKSHRYQRCALPDLAIHPHIITAMRSDGFEPSVQAWKA